MSNAKEMFYNMALQGLMPGVSDLIVNSKEFQAFTRRGVELMALVQAGDAEIDEVQAKANERAQAIISEANAKAQAVLKEANERVDAVQKRGRVAYHELVAEVRDFFTEHRLEGLLETADVSALKAFQNAAKPNSVHVLTRPADPPKTE